MKTVSLQVLVDFSRSNKIALYRDAKTQLFYIKVKSGYRCSSEPTPTSGLDLVMSRIRELRIETYRRNETIEARRIKVQKQKDKIKSLNSLEDMAKMFF